MMFVAGIFVDYESQIKLMSDSSIHSIMNFSSAFPDVYREDLSIFFSSSSVVSCLTFPLPPIFLSFLSPSLFFHPSFFPSLPIFFPSLAVGTMLHSWNKFQQLEMYHIFNIFMAY